MPADRLSSMRSRKRRDSGRSGTSTSTSSRATAARLWASARRSSPSRPNSSRRSRSCSPCAEASMAKIVGAVASSHTPTIGFAYDKKKHDDPVWAPIFEAFAPVQRWLAEKKPDVLVYICNDHVTSFFFDHYSAFALGMGESYAVADEGGGPRALPPLRGHPALSAHV